MTTAEYIAELLKRADAIDQAEILRTVAVARFAEDLAGIRAVIASDMLERIHKAWRTLDGWLNTHVNREEAPHLLEWCNTEDVVDRVSYLSTRANRTDEENAELIDRVWDIVVTLSDAGCIERFLADAQAQYHGFIAWQLMSVRQASKNALLMMEFDPEFDNAIQKM